MVPPGQSDRSERYRHEIAAAAAAAKRVLDEVAARNRDQVSRLYSGPFDIAPSPEVQLLNRILDRLSPPPAATVQPVIRNSAAALIPAATESTVGKKSYCDRPSDGEQWRALIRALEEHILKADYKLSLQDKLDYVKDQVKSKPAFAQFASRMNVQARQVTEWLKDYHAWCSKHSGRV